MTMAICWKCGETKVGAFSLCPKCNQHPQERVDLLVSVMLTSWFNSYDQLVEVGKAIADGFPIEEPNLEDPRWATMLNIIDNPEFQRILEEKKR